MVVCMHYSAAAVLEKLGSPAVRKAVAQGQLVTLAFSEAGSRSHFWAPLSTATRAGDQVTLNAKKSFSTSASKAGHGWAWKPLEGKEMSRLWWVPPGTEGVRVSEPFDGLGLRGNDSSPIVAEGAVIDASNMLGADGEGFKAMIEIVLPFFNIMNAAASVGL